MPKTLTAFQKDDQSSQNDSRSLMGPVADLSDLSLKRLQLLAEYGGFEKNAYWHRRLGRVYRSATYNNAAIKEYTTSIKMNSQDSYALQGLASCYEDRKDYFSAIQWHYKALAALPKESKAEKARILSRISNWKTLLEDLEGAIQASHEAYISSPTNVDTAAAYLTALEKNREFAAIMTFAASLETKNSPHEGENMLTFLFIKTREWNILSHAASRLGKIDSLDQSLREALKAAERRKSSPYLPSFIVTLYECDFQYGLLGRADFLNVYAFNIDEAIEIYERLLSTQDSGQEFLDPREGAKKEAKDRLSELYYHKAQAAESAGIGFDHWVTKLKGLATPSNAKDEEEVFASKISSLMLGVWYRLHGREQEAKLCFRTQILDCIDTLTDDDPNYDMLGYQDLALTLLTAGDKDNAGAAFAVVTESIDRLKANRRAERKASDEDEAFEAKTMPVEVPLHSTVVGAQAESITENAEYGDTEGNAQVTDDNAAVPDENIDTDSPEMNAQIKSEDDMPILLWGCDGKCNRRVEDWQEIHICEICINIGFCDECIELVKSRLLPFRKCDADHTFYQVYPPREEWQGVATVRTEGKIVPRAEWVEALRKEWAA